MISLFFLKLEHIKHLELVFEELINNGLVVSRKKIKLFKNQIEFLGLELENGQVKLQEHIVQKINNFPDKLENLKTLQSFLGLLNYARPYVIPPTPAWADEGGAKLY